MRNTRKIDRFLTNIMLACGHKHVAYKACKRCGTDIYRDPDKYSMNHIRWYGKMLCKECATRRQKVSLAKTLHRPDLEYGYDG